MKFFTPFFIFFCLAANAVLSQVAINTDGSAADSSAMLDVKSTTKGLLVPRLTSTQRLAISNAADGLFVYDSVAKQLFYYQAGYGWQQLLNSNGTFSLPYYGSVNSTSTALSITNTGVGDALGLLSTGGNGILAITNASGASGVMAYNLGGGQAIMGQTLSVKGSPTGSVTGRNDGPGYGIYGFAATDTSGAAIGVLGQSGVKGGKGVAGHFENLNASSSSNTLEAITNGLGSAASFIINNASDTANALSVTTNTQGNSSDPRVGNAGNFFNNNISGVGAGVRGEVNSFYYTPGTAGVYGSTSGTGGYGGYFDATNAGGASTALLATTAGDGTSLEVESENSTNYSPVIFATSFNMGPLASFSLNNPNNPSNALSLSTYGLGAVLICNQAGTAGDLAVFQTGSTNMARIDRTGKGFFDGGTQNSGADLAEAFDVEGNYNDYEPGDVLEISAQANRTVVKSSTPYSTMVAGVYATKPGVLLTEDHVNKPAEGKVPMGVIGVIPTKVCNENGPITRGDLLVTSSKPGYAMKADLNKVKIGQVLGKALEPMDVETGKINVLVNVR